MQRRQMLAFVAAAGATARAGADSGFKLQTPTALPPLSPNWDFVVLEDGDLAAILRKGAKNMTELHLLSAEGGYKRFEMQVQTALRASDEQWDFVAMPHRDIAAVLRNGASGRTEVHMLDASRRYGAFKFQTPTALPRTDGRWSFAAADNGDLYAINRRGSTGRTEVHVLDASKRYGAFKLQAITALHSTDASWDFGVLSDGDLVGIHRRGASGKTELHILGAASRYMEFRLHAPSPLKAAADHWKFAVRGNGDVLAVLTSASGSGKTELHVFGSVAPDGPKR